MVSNCVVHKESLEQGHSKKKSSGDCKRLPHPLSKTQLILAKTLKNAFKSFKCLVTK